MEQVLKQFNVPGVSIAIIQDFKVALAMAYGVADAETGAPVTHRHDVPGRLDQQAGGRDGVAAGRAGRPFTLDQDINTILKSWKLPEGEFRKNGRWR